MLSFHEQFPGKMLAVAVPVESAPQAIHNIGVAREYGADAAFLVFDQPISETPREIVAAVRKWHPDWWVGASFPLLSTLEAIKEVPLETSGLWVLESGISSSTVGTAQYALQYLRARRERRYKGLYFGRIAFNYFPHARKYDPLMMVKVAKGLELVDVIVTSDLKTSRAPDLLKVRAINKANGNFPQVVAGGVNRGNVGEYLRYSRGVIIGSAIRYPGTNNLDPQALAWFVEHKTAKRASA